MNYKSPIELIMGQMNMSLEGEICKAVQSVGVNVNKEELLKALQYDRNQYQKGYSDRDSEIVRCKDCKHRPELKLYSDRQGNYTLVEFKDGSKCPCQCEDFFYSWYPEDDWFCANGERKEE